MPAFRCLHPISDRVPAEAGTPKASARADHADGAGVRQAPVRAGQTHKFIRTDTGRRMSDSRKIIEQQQPLQAKFPFELVALNGPAVVCQPDCGAVNRPGQCDRRRSGSCMPKPAFKIPPCVLQAVIIIRRQYDRFGQADAIALADPRNRKAGMCAADINRHQFHRETRAFHCLLGAKPNTDDGAINLALPRRWCQANYWR